MAHSRQVTYVVMSDNYDVLSSPFFNICPSHLSCTSCIIFIISGWYCSQASAKNISSCVFLLRYLSSVSWATACSSFRSYRSEASFWRSLLTRSTSVVHNKCTERSCTFFKWVSQRKLVITTHWCLVNFVGPSEMFVINTPKIQNEKTFIIPYPTIQGLNTLTSLIGKLKWSGADIANDTRIFEQGRKVAVSRPVIIILPSSFLAVLYCTVFLINFTIVFTMATLISHRIKIRF